VEYALAFVLLAALVALVVVRPLRRPGEQERREETRIAELSAAKEAKYREIRDAELDHRMGKLSREDWRAVDRELRGEAIEILRELDRLEGRSPEASPPAEGAPRARR
jgi:flagellar biosynthesis/type III secretory pathway M-ring protein FliF/YscJ